MTPEAPLNARSLSILGNTLLTVGVAMGGTGFITNRDDLVRGGILLSIPAATALVVGTLRNQTAINDDQLAHAHRAGYTLALDHVARGLLDQPTAPTGGGRGDNQHDDNVCILPTLHTDDERAAG
jgi:hypothetical protein